MPRPCARETRHRRVRKLARAGHGKDEEKLGKYFSYKQEVEGSRREEREK